MIPYDSTNHHPPAPVLQITVGNVLNRRLRLTLPALLDTGLDITAIPMECVERLRLYPIGRMKFEDLSANITFPYTYKVRLTFPELTVSSHIVVVTQLDFALLGRDIMNHLDIHLYGPQLRFLINV